ncbi:MAG: SUMF1/EgtB/PvdO family nonheme iron enzyme, partial [Patescibacteria group bacterium]|nr:SUMF1/EgtB/PvdO family nonheme iron enzyme [Patescibacteria group bacterium]
MKLIKEMSWTASVAVVSVIGSIGVYSALAAFTGPTKGPDAVDHDKGMLWNTFFGADVDTITDASYSGVPVTAVAAKSAVLNEKINYIIDNSNVAAVDGTYDSSSTIANDDGNVLERMESLLEQSQEIVNNVQSGLASDPRVPRVAHAAKTDDGSSLRGADLSNMVYIPLPAETYDETTGEAIIQPDGFWVDMYEAAAADMLGNLLWTGGTVGLDYSTNDDDASVCGDTNTCNTATDRKAVSVAGANPWVRIDRDTAKLACENAGKRLITESQWMAISTHLYNQDKLPKGNNNTWSTTSPDYTSLAAIAAVDTGETTGTLGNCGSACEKASGDASIGPAITGVVSDDVFGIYDMNGNVWEWSWNTQRTDGKNTGLEIGSSGYYLYSLGINDHLWANKGTAGTRGFRHGGNASSAGDSGVFAL